MRLTPAVFFALYILYVKATYLDQSRAQEVTLLSYAAYCDAPQVKSWSCFWCKYHQDIFQSPVVTQIKVFQNESIFGFVGLTVDQIVVVFRGTVKASLANWLTDLTYRQTVPFHNGIIGAEAHDGFVEGYQDVQEQVRAAVDAFTKQYPKRPILFTGHSLGAALATLAAVDTKLTKRYSNPTLLWTLGSPRVGNTALALYIDTNFPEAVRMTNRFDPVPRLPLVSMSYLHAGREYYSRNSTVVFERCNLPKNGDEDPNCIDGSWPWQISLEDHLHYMGLNKHLAC